MCAAENLDSLAAIWAKSAAQGAAEGEGLLAHTSTVVSRLLRLHDILPALHTTVGDQRLWQRAYLACVLHDFGKGAAGFQHQLRPGGKPWRRRHEVLSLAFLDWLVGEDPHDDATWISAAVVSHHRDFDIIERLYTADGTPDADPFDPVVDIVSDIEDPVVAGLANVILTIIPHSIEKTPFFISK